jgi:hypothetical protein
MEQARMKNICGYDTVMDLRIGYGTASDVGPPMSSVFSPDTSDGMYFSSFACDVGRASNLGKAIQTG